MLPHTHTTEKWAAGHNRSNGCPEICLILLVYILQLLIFHSCGIISPSEMPRRAGIGGLGHGLGASSLAAHQAAQVSIHPACGFVAVVFPNFACTHFAHIVGRSGRMV